MALSRLVPATGSGLKWEFARDWLNTEKYLSLPRQEYFNTLFRALQNAEPKYIERCFGPLY